MAHPISNLTRTMDPLEGDSGIGGLTVEEVLGAAQIASLITSVTALLGLGCRLKLTDIEEREKGVSLGLLLHVLAVPFLSFLTCVYLRVGAADALPTLVIASAPIAGYSTLLTGWAKGDVTLCVLLAVLSSCLSVGFLPLCFYVFSSYWHNDFIIVAGPLDVAAYIAVIIAPVGAGMGLHHYFPKATVYISRVCSGAFLIKVAGTFIFMIVYYPQQFLVDWTAWVAIIVTPLVGFLIGLSSSHVLGLPLKTSIAIAISLGAINSNMVISVGLDTITDVQQLQALLKVPLIHFIVTPVQGLVWVALCRYLGKEKYPELFGSETKLIDVIT